MNTARVTKVANPRRKARAKRRNGPRRFSAKQIKAGFGGKRRQNAARHRHKARPKVKAKRRRNVVAVKRRRRRAAPRAAANPPRRRARPRVKVKAKRRRRRATSNPSLLMTLGPVNPRRGKGEKVARRKARRNRPRVHVKRRKHNKRHVARRNPSVFGSSSGKDLATIGGGIILGVSAAKLIPPMFDTALGEMASSLPAKIVITGVVAFGVGAAAKKFMPGPLGDAIIAGGLAQTASMALNALLPATFPYRSSLTLNGVGDFAPTPRGVLTVPWNPVGAPSQLASDTVRAMAAQQAGLAFAR